VKHQSVLIAVGCLTLAACGDGVGQTRVDMLVDRFDVPECLDTEFQRSQGESTEDGHRVLREYVADAECMNALESSLKSMDFEELRPRTFEAQRDGGWTETVVIGRWFDNTRTNIRWEEINP